MYVCVCVCMYVYIYIYIYTHLSSYIMCIHMYILSYCVLCARRFLTLLATPNDTP